jgi:hypothetical protein
MANKKRYINVLSTKITFAEESVSNNTTFADILRFMNGKEYRYSDKIFEFSLMDSTIENCIVGIIETTQDKDIPPIKDKRTKQFSQVDINPATQGLAFANIFLYDIQRNIFLYEINKNGCFPKQLSEFIVAKWNAENEDVKFDLTFPAVFRANEYQRMLQMNYYKRIIIELYKPDELINCFDENTESLENNILKHNLQVSTQTNADTIKLEQVAIAKRLNPMGLSHTLVKGFVDAVKLNIADKGFIHNIQTLKVTGYSGDPEDKALKPIDILGDTFKEYFKITDIQVQSDVQRMERKVRIEELYNKILPELRQLNK